MWLKTKSFTNNRILLLWFGLQEYIESLMKKEQRSEQMKIRDPRSERESVHASALLNLVLVSTHKATVT